VKIAEFLKPTDVLVESRALDKTSLIKNLCTHAASRLGIPAAAIQSSIARREALGSTGIGNGVAIPHANIAGLTEPFGVAVKLDNAVEFDAIDEGKVDVVVLLLMPETPSQSQLNALACVARRLREPEIRSRLRSASQPDRVYEILTSADAKPLQAAAATAAKRSD
jgi:PTS system nitrogen regulatory IIA component